jgi:hypothetical protein
LTTRCAVAEAIDSKVNVLRDVFAATLLDAGALPSCKDAFTQGAKRFAESKSAAGLWLESVTI